MIKISQYFQDNNNNNIIPNFSLSFSLFEFSVERIATGLDFQFYWCLVALLVALIVRPRCICDHCSEEAQLLDRCRFGVHGKVARLLMHYHLHSILSVGGFIILVIVYYRTRNSVHKW